MAWITRNGRKSYHRYRRVNGKVVHTYVGTGPLALRAAKLDEEQRQERQRERQERNCWIATFKQGEANREKLDRNVELLLRAELLFAGFYLWNRCRWRKREMEPKHNPQAHREGKPLPPKQPPAAEQAVARPPTIQEELHRLVDAANTGDTASLHQLRQFLGKHPHIARHCGDLVRHAKETLLRRISGNEALLGESVRLELDRLKEELLPVNPHATQVLAVERVLLNYVEIHLYDTLYPDIASLGLQQAKVVATAKNSAERRYAQSLRTLAALIRALPAKKRKKINNVGAPGLKLHAGG